MKRFLLFLLPLGLWAQPATLPIAPQFGGTGVANCSTCTLTLNAANVFATTLGVYPGTFLVSNVSSPTTPGGFGIDLVYSGAPVAVTVTDYGVSGNTNSPGFFGYAARGTITSPAAVQAGDLLGSYSARGYFGLGFASSSTVGMGLYAAETWSSLDRGSYIVFGTTNTGGHTTAAEAMRIQPSGGVSIGSSTFNATDPGQGMLAIQGLVATGSVIFQGTTATDSASLGAELTTNGTCSGTGWTGTYPNYVAPGTTAPLTCTGFTSGQFYQTVTTIGSGGSGAVTIAIGTAQTASGSSGTVTAGLKANGTSLTYTPAATYTGTIGISAKLITPISTFSVTGKDSTGAVSGVALWQSLASLHNSFSGGGGSYNTTGTNNSAQGLNALYSNTTGTNNSAQGLNALYSNTTGNNNSAQGVNALYSNTTGYNNSAQGV